MRTPFTRTSCVLVAALAAGAIALTACGDAADQPIDNGQGVAVGEPNGQDGGAAGGTRPAGEDFAPEERAEMLFGKTEDEAMNIAQEFGWPFRVGREGDTEFMVTEDYVIDRITAELDYEGPNGEAVVTVVTIELEERQATYRAE